MQFDSKKIYLMLHINFIKYLPFLLGRFVEWSKNTPLLRELYSLEPFLHKVGSKKAGQKWTEVAEKLNCFGLFRDMPLDQRSVREQVNKLLKHYKKKKNEDEQASGIKLDPPT